MKLKTVKALDFVLAGLFFILILLYILTQVSVFYLAAVVIIIVMSALTLIFWRCPHCGASLGRGKMTYCRHCGKKIDFIKY